MSRGRTFTYDPYLAVQPRPSICPHCKQIILVGERVHWYEDVLWHTKPCPVEVAP